MQDELAKRKARRPQYSLRAFARDLKVSPSFLSEFLSGHQGMSRDRVFRIGDYISLHPEQINHFWDLVESQFGRSEEIKASAKLRCKVREQNPQTRLDVDRYKAIAEWYHMPILEMLCLGSVQLSSENIASALGIESFEVEESITRLKELGLLSQLSDGTFKANEEATIVGGVGTNKAIQTSHKQLLKKHSDYVEGKSVDNRKSLSLSFSLSNSDWNEMTQKMQESIINTISKYSNKQTDSDQVVSFTMQSVKLISDWEKEK